MRYKVCEATKENEAILLRLGIGYYLYSSNDAEEMDGFIYADERHFAEVYNAIKANRQSLNSDHLF